MQNDISYVIEHSTYNTAHMIYRIHIFLLFQHSESIKQTYAYPFFQIPLCLQDVC